MLRLLRLHSFRPQRVENARNPASGGAMLISPILFIVYGRVLACCAARATLPAKRPSGPCMSRGLRVSVAPITRREPALGLRHADGRGSASKVVCGGREASPLLSPKQVYRPASSTAFRAAGSPRTPVVPFHPHRSRGPGKQDGILCPSPFQSRKG